MTDTNGLKICACCGEPFEPTTPTQRYGSRTCQEAQRSLDRMGINKESHDLFRRIRAHEYECDICGARFKRSTLFRRHMRDEHALCYSNRRGTFEPSNMAHLRTQGFEPVPSIRDENGLPVPIGSTMRDDEAVDAVLNGGGLKACSKRKEVLNLRGRRVECEVYVLR